jgi:hypothetical protein
LCCFSLLVRHERLIEGDESEGPVAKESRFGRGPDGRAAEPATAGGERAADAQQDKRGGA